jgi:hypothetical protein
MLGKEMLFSINGTASVTVLNKSKYDVQVIAWGVESSSLGWERIGSLYGTGSKTFLMNIPCKYVEVSFSSHGGISAGILVNAKVVEDNVRIIDLTKNAYVEVIGKIVG